MERKTKIKIVTCLTLFFAITLGMLISLFYSQQIEIALGLTPAGTGTLKNYQFKVDIIDVGQGSSSLITLPTGENILIDAGTNSSEKQLIRYLNKQNISQIDYFIITHSDNDHTGGADAIFENFEVKEIYRPFILSKNDKYEEDNDPLLFYSNVLGEDSVTIVSGGDYAKCINLMYKETYTENGSQKQSKINICNENVLLPASTAILKMWSPKVIEGSSDVYHENIDDRNLTYGKPTQKYSTTNNYSPIMTINFLSVTIVITGDASSVVEREVLSIIDDDELESFKNCEVYVAGHHGSNSSSCEEFLSLLMPKYVAVQCGNSSSHPHADFLSRVESIWKDSNKTGTVLTTYNNGDIVFYYAASNDLKTVDKAVSYSGNANQIVTHWWQIVVTVIVVAAIFLLMPLIPKSKKLKIRKKKQLKK